MGKVFKEVIARKEREGRKPSLLNRF